MLHRARGELLQSWGAHPCPPVNLKDSQDYKQASDTKTAEAGPRLSNITNLMKWAPEWHRWLHGAMTLFIKMI